MTSPDTAPVRVVHVITGLLVGGAESALARLVSALPRAEFRTLVVSLLAEGPLAAPLRAAGAEVVSLGMRRGVPTPAAAWRLRRVLRQFRPAVVQGWMYHGNLAAWLGLRGSGLRIPLAWNIRQTLADLRREPRGTRAVIRAGAWLSSGIPVTVYNSELAREQHAALGFRSPATVVIPNGFDLEQFRPSEEARRSLRRELGLSDDALVVGLVNRLHPMKGHGTFLEAARRVLDAGHQVTFVCAGSGVTPSDPGLGATIRRLGLADRVRLLGERFDTPRLFAGFDVACMTSGWGEGFPNVVGEAMACGTPCVATQVGDTATLLGPGGAVVPPGDTVAFAGGLLAVLALPAAERRLVGQRGRAHIAERYSLGASAERYAGLYRRLAATRPAEDGA